MASSSRCTECGGQSSTGRIVICGADYNPKGIRAKLCYPWKQSWKLRPVALLLFSNCVKGNTIRCWLYFERFALVCKTLYIFDSIWFYSSIAMSKPQNTGGNNISQKIVPWCTVVGMYYSSQHSYSTACYKAKMSMSFFLQSKRN